MTEVGDFCFATAVKNRPGKGLTVSFKGHAICLLIGHIEPGAPPPTPLEAASLMGAAGYVSLDDVLEILGRDAQEEMIKELTKRFKNSGGPDDKWPEETPG